MYVYSLNIPYTFTEHTHVLKTTLYIGTLLYIYYNYK
ncbi:hypothetical protein D910_08724, partial [Dendroctonus ponderosae]